MAENASSEGSQRVDSHAAGVAREVAAQCARKLEQGTAASPDDDDAYAGEVGDGWVQVGCTPLQWGPPLPSP